MSKFHITQQILELVLGEQVDIFGHRYKFIKSTKKGYRFLDLDTHICLTRLVYPVKNKVNMFWVPRFVEKIIIKKVISK